MDLLFFIKKIKITKSKIPNSGYIKNLVQKYLWTNKKPKNFINMKIKALLVALAVGTAAQVYAQQTGMNILEKDYEISRKAKKGYLGGVEAKENGNFDMVYFLPSSRRKVKIEVYSFDKDANLKNTLKDEWDVEKVKKKWKWFNFKGDEYSTTAASLSTNLSGKMMFKKRLIKAKYNWLVGGYLKSIKMLDRQKLTSENGEEYLFSGAYEVERDSTILALAYPYTKGSSYSNLDLIKVNNEGVSKKLASVPTSSPMKPIFSKPLLDDNSRDVDNDDFPRDWVVVLAPTKAYGKSNTGNPNQLTYLRISPEGNLKENFTFNSPDAGYRILNAYEKNGTVLLYGMSIKKDGKYADEVLGQTVSPSSMDDEEKAATSSGGGMLGGLGKMAGMISGKEELAPSQASLDNALDEKKYDNFVITKIQNGNAVYVRPTAMPELNQKAVAGSDMKKPLEFDGKKFTANNFQILKDGSFVLCLQDFKPSSGGIGGNKLLGALTGVSRSGSSYDRVYKGMYMLHFSPEGSLVRNYTVLLDQKNKKGFFNNSPMTADNFPATSYVIESKDGKSINWIMEMVKAIDKDTSVSTLWDTTTTTTTYSPFYSIEYGKLDLSTGKSSEFRTLGDLEKKKYYLYDKHNRIQIGDYTYFFSETPNGDRLLISRMNVND